MKYLCGCDPEAKKHYRAIVLPNGNTSHLILDDEGYQVCPEHGERLYGWKTSHAGGVNPKIDYSNMGSGGNLSNIDFSQPDMRDTRDPQTMGLEIQAKGNGHK